MASTIKVDNVQNQPGTNIINKCSTTITIGASSDTVALACGATQTGFGRTGTVDWNTTKITADPANAVSGTGYFCDTSGGAFTVTLPTSPSAGDIVAVADYTRTFATYNLTIGRNSKPIGGSDNDAKLDTNGQSATFVFVDDTEGWINTQETSASIIGQSDYVIATVSGACNTLTTVDTNYKVAKFVGPGTFTVSCAGTACGNNKADYLVVAGGGGGYQNCGADNGGAGGAGGFRESYTPAVSGPYTASPLKAACGAITLTAQGYPIVVGGGGAYGPPPPPSPGGTPGEVSSGLGISSAGGGGGGGAGNPTLVQGNDGGSGGGASGGAGTCNCAGAGNTPPVSPPQGQPGGKNTSGSPDSGGGGGGGATEAGVQGSAGASGGARGGAGATTEITNTPTAYAGGAGSACGAQSPCGTGGYGGNGPLATTPNVNGDTNTGGGGGGAKSSGIQGSGGSGIVVIRYKFQ
jgi:hypothetical protein